MRKRTQGNVTLERGKSLKNLACDCGTIVLVDAFAIAVKCPLCVMKKVPAPELVVREKHEEGFPQGWRWMKQFVHADGRVFEKGAEVVSLKGTIAPTTIPSKFERRKRREEKETKKMNRLAKKYKKKMATKETNARRPRGSTGNGILAQTFAG